MVKTWYLFADKKLSQLERLGAPSWLVTAAAYVLGIEIAAYFSGNR
jgi:hypothetical protein